MQQALLLRSLLRQCRSRSTNASISMDDVAREVQSLQQQLHAREAKPGLRANAGQGAASKSRRSSEQGSGGGGSDGSKSAGSSSSSSTSGSYRVGGGTGGADGGLQQQQGLGTKRMAIEVDASNASSVLGHTGTAPRASAGTGGT